MTIYKHVNHRKSCRQGDDGETKYTRIQNRVGESIEHQVNNPDQYRRREQVMKPVPRRFQLEQGVVEILWQCDPGSQIIVREELIFVGGGKVL